MKILIAAGGTGGHIYPALAIADALKKRDATISFVGTRTGLENKIIPPKGYALFHLPIGRLNSNVSVVERLKTLLLMPFAFLKSISLLRRERPDFVLGVGGHASGPLLLMASMFGYRSAIWEPNAMPGLANRWLARYVDDCWVVFDEARPLLKNPRLHPAGMPVREEIENVRNHRADSEFHILVFGGSQGSRGLNNVVSELLQNGGVPGARVVHQTGPADFARISQAVAGVNGVEVKEYLHDMSERYAWADLVIARSGTGTLSELAACGKPAILIPLPTAADDHQRRNAESLVKKGAAIMLLQKDLTWQRLRAAIDELRAHPEKLAEMSRNVKSFHHPRAAEILAGEFVERIHASR